ncbi:MAG: tetratricopeptide repeat protein [Candidatus Competibacteraceae bacterium]
MNQAGQWKPAVKRVNVDERERLKRGKALLRQKDYNEALTEFKAILENNPKSINALLGIGLIYLKQEQLDEALPWLRQAKSLDPLQPKPYFLEGMVLSQQGDLEGAEQAFRAALAIDPRLNRALIGLGEVLLSRQRYDEALAQCEAARYNPQQTAARLLIAKIYVEQHKINEAITEIRTVLEIDPSQIRAYLLPSAPVHGGLVIKES